MLAQVDLAQRGITKFPLEFLSPAAKVIQGRHIVIDVPLLVFGDLEEPGIVDREPDQEPGIPDPLQEILEHGEGVFTQASIANGPSMRRDADGMVTGRLLHPMRLVIPAPGTEAEPLDRAALFPIP